MVLVHSRTRAAQRPNQLGQLAWGVREARADVEGPVRGRDQRADESLGDVVDVDEVKSLASVPVHLHRASSERCADEVRDRAAHGFAWAKDGGEPKDGGR